MRKIKYKEAIYEATDQALSMDESVILMGLGVPDPKGIFGTTRGLQEKYGANRVMDTPTAENGVTGIALGASLAGMRPIITHQRVEFSLLAIEQMVNQAAKWHYMTAGKMKAPMVFRLIIGRGWGQGPQHSQSLESWFAHIPGLKVVAPANARDAKGLLLSAVADDNPVIILEHRWLYETFSVVPELPFKIEIGKAKVVQSGTDVTIVTYSYMVIEALNCADISKNYGISVEVIDLRSMRPLDVETILTSVKKTGALLTIDNGWKNMGIGSEIVAAVVEKQMHQLKKPPIRLALKDVPVPSTRSLANLVYVSCDEIIGAIEDLTGKSIERSDKRPVVKDTPDQSFLGPF